MSVRFAIGLAIATAAVPGRVHASTIGLYTDQTGSTCSFAGNAQGEVTAYVVVKADAAGVLSAQFSAPVPACLGAVHLYDQWPDGGFVVGNSQSGVSVGFPFCTNEGYPSVALTITYFRAGSTEACCAYPTLAAPTFSVIEGTNCSSQPIVLTAVTSHFNANESCPCADAAPPLPPQDPAPMNNETDVAVDMATLTWADPIDPDIVAYDVYFGTDASPAIVETVTLPQYQLPASLQFFTRYYWRVVARDIDGLETSGPTWTFITRPANYPPFPPFPVFPVNGSIDAPLTTSLQWGATDLEGDALSYDVYFGTATNPPLVASGLMETTYAIATTLDHSTTYRWKVVVHDATGSTSGPVWNFTTLPPPDPITTYFNDVGNQPFNQLALTWQVVDPPAGPLTYSVYLGTGFFPPLVATGLTTASYVVNLGVFKSYHWKVVAHDGQGNHIEGPVWNFGTKQNTPPTMHWRSPANGAIVPPGTTLNWSASDPDGDLILYNVFLGTGTTIPLVASGISASSYDPGLLQSQTYSWECRLWDVHGDGSRGFEAATGDMFFTVSPIATGTGNIPVELTLRHNHPNPFNPQTVIPYGVPVGASQRVRLVIYDTSGRTVRVLVDEHQTPGMREVTWNGIDDAGTRVSSGVYYCVLSLGDDRRTQKLVLLK